MDGITIALSSRRGHSPTVPILWSDNKRQRPARELHRVAFELFPRPSRDSVSGHIACGCPPLIRTALIAIYRGLDPTHAVETDLMLPRISRWCCPQEARSLNDEPSAPWANTMLGLVCLDIARSLGG